MEIGIDVLPFSDSLRDAYERLLPEQSGGVARGKLQWRFHTNPASDSVFSVARDQITSDIVGINAFMALKLRLNNKIVTAYQSMDTIVDPRCRGQGLFSRLLKAFYVSPAALNAAVLYGFPNNNSAPGFFNKLGWRRLASPPFLIKPLRLGYFLTPLLGKAARYLDFPLAWKRKPDPPNLIALERFDARVDSLWHEVAKTFVCAVERDHVYLNWRICDHPEMHYTTKALIDKDESLQAFVTYIVVDKHGGRIGYVMEALAKPGHEKSLQALFQHITADCISQKADAILAWCPSHAPNHKTYRRAGFWVLPEKLRPITLHFGYKPLSTVPEVAELRYQDWYLSYLDSDTV